MVGPAGKLTTRIIISPVSRFSACKILAVQCKRNIFKFWVEQRWCRKKVCFFTDTGKSYLRNSGCYWSL